MQEWKLPEWKNLHGNAGGGKCRSGNGGTIMQGVENEGVQNACTAIPCRYFHSCFFKPFNFDRADFSTPAFSAPPKATYGDQPNEIRNVEKKQNLMFSIILSLRDYNCYLICIRFQFNWHHTYNITA